MRQRAERRNDRHTRPLMKLNANQTAALTRVTRTKIRLDELNRTRANALGTRNRAIQDALATGLTLRTVAPHAGISNPAVHKIRYLQLAPPIASPNGSGPD